MFLPCTVSRCGWRCRRACLESVTTSSSRLSAQSSSCEKYVYFISLYFHIIKIYCSLICKKIYVAVIMHILSVTWPLWTLKKAIKHQQKTNKTPFVVVVVFNIGYGRHHIITVLSKYYENVIISLSGLYILTFIFLINLTGSWKTWNKYFVLDARFQFAEIIQS